MKGIVNGIITTAIAAFEYIQLPFESIHRRIKIRLKAINERSMALKRIVPSLWIALIASITEAIVPIMKIAT